MVELLNVAMICRVQADVAQVVAHLIGSEEVTGPSPVISSLENSLKIAVLFDKCRVFRDFLRCEYHG